MVVESACDGHIRCHDSTGCLPRGSLLAGDTLVASAGGIGRHYSVCCVHFSQEEEEFKDEDHRLVVAVDTGIQVSLENRCMHGLRFVGQR